MLFFWGGSGGGGLGAGLGDVPWLRSQNFMSSISFAKISFTLFAMMEGFH